MKKTLHNELSHWLTMTILVACTLGLIVASYLEIRPMEAKATQYKPIPNDFQPPSTGGVTIVVFRTGTNPYYTPEKLNELDEWEKQQMEDEDPYILVLRMRTNQTNISASAKSETTFSTAYFNITPDAVADHKNLTNLSAVAKQRRDAEDRQWLEDKLWAPSRAGTTVVAHLSTNDTAEAMPEDGDDHCAKSASGEEPKRVVLIDRNQKVVIWMHSHLDNFSITTNQGVSSVLITNIVQTDNHIEPKTIPMNFPKGIQYDHKPYIAATERYIETRVIRRAVLSFDWHGPRSITNDTQTSYLKETLALNHDKWVVKEATTNENPIVVLQRLMLELGYTNDPSIKP